MSAKLSAYSVPPSVQSALLLKTPDSIPPTNELELLHNELKELKKLTLARSKKASEDLKTIEESMRRMNEKEKGKAKAIDKVKRERDCTYDFFRRVSHFSDGTIFIYLFLKMLCALPSLPSSLL